MKRLLQYLSVALAIPVLASRLAADPEPQPQLLFSPGAVGTWTADWQGVAGRTYFIQWSLDLVDWHYAPFVDFGNELHSRGLDASTEKFFLRLHYGDYPGINSLEDAMNADFDGDGLSNVFEVTAGLNPFRANSTANGTDASQDPEQDGLNNAAESAQGLNPAAKDNPKVQLQVTVE